MPKVRRRTAFTPFVVLTFAGAAFAGVYVAELSTGSDIGGPVFGIVCGGVMMTCGVLGLLLSGSRGRTAAVLALAVIVWAVGGFAYLSDQMTLKIVGLVLFCSAILVALIFGRRLRAQSASADAAAEDDAKDDSKK